MAQDGVGLAAPQIGVDLRIVIFGFDENPRYPDAESVPFLIQGTDKKLHEECDFLFRAAPVLGTGASSRN